ALVWLLLGLAVVGAPPTWRNSRLAGHLVGPTVNAGLNLYIGNGPEANGFYVAAVPGDWRRDPAGRAFLAGRFGRDAVSLAEADRLWRDAALAEMRARPGRTAALFLRKLWLHVQGWEIDQLTPLAGWTRTVPLLRGWLVPYALLVVLGSAGLAAAWGRSDGGVLRWALAVLVVLLLGQSLFFVVSRYRLALVPFWCVAAGWGAVHLAARRRAAWVAAALAAVLVVPWGLNGVRATWSGLAAANEALRWADVGVATGDASALERAVALYREAVAVAPDRTPSWLGLAAALGARGDESGRRTVLREGARQASDPVPLWRALLGAALAGNDPVAAREAAEQVLVRDPDDAEALHNLAVLLARTGDPAAALAAARRLRAAHPADARGYIDEGVILARAGRRDEARAVFRAGLERLPDDPALRRNLALVSD
ncbi:tetratricopeptide repeat protein, partial [bacterium]|nr:tetratricopeptide repeat protein [bacterium]